MKLRYFSEVLADHPQTVAGWQRGDGDMVIANPGYGTIVHLAVCRDDGRPMYDLPAWAEPPGAIIVPVTADGRVVMIENLRPIAPSNAGPGVYPPPDLGRQGRISLEFPRGFPLAGERAQEAARRETEEETNLRVLHVALIGECNPNTTYFLTNLPVFMARVALEQAFAQPDVHEEIGALHFLTVPEALSLVAAGKVICALTKAALLHYIAQGHSATEKRG
jgi:8-oxo-dGTP pyrophosphatase MutT (NUDIX family)